VRRRDNRLAPASSSSVACAEPSGERVTSVLEGGPGATKCRCRRLQQDRDVILAALAILHIVGEVKKEAGGLEVESDAAWMPRLLAASRYVRARASMSRFLMPSRRKCPPQRASHLLNRTDEYSVKLQALSERDWFETYTIWPDPDVKRTPAGATPSGVVDPLHYTMAVLGGVRGPAK
jgi:hypothetical protein